MRAFRRVKERLKGTQSISAAELYPAVQIVVNLCAYICHNIVELHSRFFYLVCHGHDTPQLSLKTRGLFADEFPVATSTEKHLRIYVAGHTGMVGSAISRRLQRAGYPILLPPERVDLCDQVKTRQLLEAMKPDWIFLAAAKVGGIHANSMYPADFIYTNLMIQTNVLHAAYLTGVKKVLVLGSSCIYPKLAPQPMKEEYLLSGYLEPTNEAYAVAKIAGIVTAESYNKQYGTNFVSVMPCNLYGPHDNFDLDGSHVIPALMRKTHEAKLAGTDSVEIWGTGNPLREFLHVDDLADACLFLMETYDASEIINVGAGKDISIHDLAFLIKEVVGYQGELKFNPNMSDGMARKLLDVSRISALGWKPSIQLREGLFATYEWYLENENRLRK